MSKDDVKPAPKSRYRKIEVRMWGDLKFRDLSPLPACGQGLWLFLLTGPHTGPIPGLFRTGRAAMAEELNWDLEAFDKAFGEVFQQGMVEADWKAKVVWIPKAIECNRPESPNVVLSWGGEWDLIPECALKCDAYESLKASIYGLGEAFAKAFDKAFAKPCLKPSAKAMPKTCANQEQEQEQEQDKALPPAQPVLVNQPAPEKKDSERWVATAVQLAITFRSEKVVVQAGNPTLDALARKGCTVELAKAACAEARSSKPNETISFGYVLKIIERWQTEAERVESAKGQLPLARASPGGKPVSKQSNFSSLNYDEGIGENGRLL